MAVETLSPNIAPEQTEVLSWYKLFARFKAAEAAWGEHDALYFNPLHETYRANWPNWPEAGSKEFEQAERWKQVNGYEEECDEQERLVNIACALEDTLMERPSPDKAAVIWKLDKLLGTPCGDSTTCWSMDYARQAITDYRRFLGAAS